MFETLTKGFRTAKQRFQGLAELDDTTVDEALKDVRTALLEADVGFDVVQDFCARVKEKAVGVIVKVKASTKEKTRRVTPEDHFVKLCHDELVDLMGPVDTSIKFAKKGPTGIMLVGLQGSGKTTTVGKLAHFLQKQHKRPLLVAADVYRPAAIDQLKIIGEKLEMPVFADPGGKPPDICDRAVQFAAERGRDVILFDTAGRLAIDEPLMQELSQIDGRVHPGNILLVVDAMIGQDAVGTAKAFNERLDLDGVILTKLDGDARGGAALAVRAVTGKPIKFVSVGEKLDQHEEFYPDRMASRILGMGDVMSLIERAQEQFDEKQALEMEAKIRKAEFTLEDFLEQLRAVRKMTQGQGMAGLLGMLPGVGRQLKNMKVDERQIDRVEVIILSMTPYERRNPKLIDGSRRRRIAAGSGTNVQTVNQLLGQFKQMQKMMKQVGKGKMPQFPGMPRR